MDPHWKGLRSTPGSSAGSVVQVPQEIFWVLKASREVYLPLGRGVAAVPPLVPPLVPLALPPDDPLLPWSPPTTPLLSHPASRAPPSTSATTDMDLLRRAPYVFMCSCLSLRPVSRITMWTHSWARTGER